MGNSVTVVMRKAPYGSVYSAEGFRSIMGVGVFEMDISVLFIDDGVYVLKRGQDPSAMDMKALSDGFPMLGDFGVSRFYVHDRSLLERGLSADDLAIETETVDDAGIAELMAASGIVLPF